MFRILELAWRDWAESHIARHRVRWDEVEEVCFNKQRLVTNMRRRRYRLIGQTDAGRYLTVIVDSLGKGRFVPVTARDATGNERHRFHRSRGD